MNFVAFIFLIIIIFTSIFIYYLSKDKSLTGLSKNCYYNHKEYRICASNGDYYCKKCEILWTNVYRYHYILDDKIINDFYNDTGINLEFRCSVEPFLYDI